MKDYELPVCRPSLVWEELLDVGWLANDDARTTSHVCDQLVDVLYEHLGAEISVAVVTTEGFFVHEGRDFDDCRVVYVKEPPGGGKSWWPFRGYSYSVYFKRSAAEHELRHLFSRYWNQAGMFFFRAAKDEIDQIVRRAEKQTSVYGDEAGQAVFWSILLRHRLLLMNSEEGGELMRVTPESRES